MRQEIENWWRQGLSDLDKAKVLFKSCNYDGTAFFCQQAVEKALKALILYKSKTKRVEGHSLVYLGREAGVPTSFFLGLRKLSPQYFIARYPDVSEEVPYELYDEKIAAEFLKTCQEVTAWIGKQLQ